MKSLDQLEAEMRALSAADIDKLDSIIDEAVDTRTAMIVACGKLVDEAFSRIDRQTPRGQGRVKAKAAWCKQAGISIDIARRRIAWFQSWEVSSRARQS